MTTANISSYAFNSSNDIFYTMSGSRTYASNVNSIRDEINNFSKVANSRWITLLLIQFHPLWF